jgi:hypothetical protein
MSSTPDSQTFRNVAFLLALALLAAVICFSWLTGSRWPRQKAKGYLALLSSQILGLGEFPCEASATDYIRSLRRGFQLFSALPVCMRGMRNGHPIEIDVVPRDPKRPLRTVVAVLYARPIVPTIYVQPNSAVIRFLNSVCKSILPLARLRGWQEVTRDGESLLPYFSSSWKRLLSTQASAYGTWQGLRAEFTASFVYKNRDATTATVECTHPVVGLGPLAATDRDDPRYRDYHLISGETETIPVQPTALLQRFRLSGQERDLRAVFVPGIERAVLDFPGKLYSVSFHGNSASVVWIGHEKNPSIVDAALDLAASICHQVDATTGDNSLQPRRWALSTSAWARWRSPI